MTCPTCNAELVQHKRPIESVAQLGTSLLEAVILFGLYFLLVPFAPWGNNQIIKWHFAVVTAIWIATTVFLDWWYMFHIMTIYKLAPEEVEKSNLTP